MERGVGGVGGGEGAGAAEGEGVAAELGGGVGGEGAGFGDDVGGGPVEAAEVGGGGVDLEAVGGEVGEVAADDLIVVVDGEGDGGVGVVGESSGCVHTCRAGHCGT